MANIGTVITSTGHPSAIDVAALARVIHAEGRGEPLEGQEYLAYAVMNIATEMNVPVNEACKMKGIASGKLQARFIEVARRCLITSPTHNFTYWLNPTTSTDKKWLMFARKQTGDSCFNHYFFVF